MPLGWATRTEASTERTSTSTCVRLHASLLVDFAPTCHLQTVDHDTNNLFRGSWQVSCHSHWACAQIVCHFKHSTWGLFLLNQSVFDLFQSSKQQSQSSLSCVIETCWIFSHFYTWISYPAWCCVYILHRYYACPLSLQSSVSRSFVTKAEQCSGLRRPCATYYYSNIPHIFPLIVIRL